ncbi:MAG: hypothetical protein U1E65_35340 [Myxococcota bacterium]
MIPAQWVSALGAARHLDQLQDSARSPASVAPPKLAVPEAPLDRGGLSPALRRAELERHAEVLKALLISAGMTEDQIQLDLGRAPRTLRQNLSALLHRPARPAFEVTLRALIAEREDLGLTQTQQILGQAFVAELTEARGVDGASTGRLTALLQAMDPALRAAVLDPVQTQRDPGLEEIVRGVRTAVQKHGGAFAAYLELQDGASAAALAPLFHRAGDVVARNQAQCLLLEEGRFDAFEKSRAAAGPRSFPDDQARAFGRFLETLERRDTRVSSVQGTLDALVFFRDTVSQPGWAHGYLIGAAHHRGSGPTQFQAVLGRLVDRWLEEGRRPGLVALGAREAALLEAEPFVGGTYFRFAERLDVLDVLHDKGVIEDHDYQARMKRIVRQRLPEARHDRFVNMWQGNILTIMNRNPSIDFGALPGVRRELLGAEELRQVAGATARPAVADAANLLAERFPRPIPSWHLQSAVGELHAVLRDPAKREDPRVKRLLALDFSTRAACFDELRHRLRHAAGLT